MMGYKRFQSVWRTMGFTFVAFLAGLLLQCASDKDFIGDGGIVDTWLVDVGLKEASKPDRHAVDTAQSDTSREVATQDQLIKDQTGKDLPGVDQAGKDLPGADQAGKDLPGADQAGKDLPGADQAGKDLPGADQAGKDKSFVDLLLKDSIGSVADAAGDGGSKTCTCSTPTVSFDAADVSEILVNTMEWRNPTSSTIPNQGPVMTTGPGEKVLFMMNVLITDTKKYTSSYPLSMTPYIVPCYRAASATSGYTAIGSEWMYTLANFNVSSTSYVAVNHLVSINRVVVPGAGTWRFGVCAKSSSMSSELKLSRHNLVLMNQGV